MFSYFYADIISCVHDMVHKMLLLYWKEILVLVLVVLSKHPSHKFYENTGSDIYKWVKNYEWTYTPDCYISIVYF